MTEAKQMTVGVIIPCFNAEGYVRETIESVLAQTYSPILIAVVDDGSTDSSPEIVRKLSEQFPTVQLFQQLNQGAAVARNLGVQRLSERVDAFVFLDSDDRLLPDGIRTLNEEGLAEGEMCAHGIIESIDSNGELITSENIWKFTKETRLAPIERTHTTLEMLAYRSLANLACCIFRKEALTICGGFVPGLRTVEDWEFQMRIAQSIPIRFVAKPVSQYRSHEQSLLSSSGAAELRRRRAWAREIIEARLRHRPNELKQYSRGYHQKLLDHAEIYKPAIKRLSTRKLGWFTDAAKWIYIGYQIRKISNDLNQ